MSNPLFDPLFYLLGVPLIVGWFVLVDFIFNKSRWIHKNCINHKGMYGCIGTEKFVNVLYDENGKKEFFEKGIQRLNKEGFGVEE